MVLFLVMCFAFGLSPRNRTSDGVRLPPIVSVTHIQPLQAVFADYQYKEPKIDEIINTAPNGSASTYEAGQCVWFVAETIGVPSNMGNATDWVGAAASLGYRVSSVPKKGAVAQTSSGYYGHVGIVQAVDGGNVLVAEMNVQGPFVEDTAWYPATTFTYIYFGTY